MEANLAKEFLSGEFRRQKSRGQPKLQWRCRSRRKHVTTGSGANEPLPKKEVGEEAKAPLGDASSGFSSRANKWRKSFEEAWW